MEKININNRNDERIVVLLDKVNDQKGVVFIMHGLGGFKEQDQIIAISDVFKNNDFTTIRFDTRNTFGESEGNYEDASITNYYEDLVDVIQWAKDQEWFQKPFVLVGHSLGGICTALYAENHPDEVKALAPLSTVINYELKLKSPKYQKNVKEWDETGWRVSESKSKPGVTKRLKWHQFKEDYKKYDLLPKVDKLTMPVLLVVGGDDESTPLSEHKILFERLPEPKELHVINGSGHTFREKDHVKELKKIVDDWIKVLL